MKTTSILLLLVLVNSLLFSCMIEKRLFNKGYHVEWHSKFKKPNENKNESVLVNTDEVSTESEQILEEDTDNPKSTLDTLDLVTFNDVTDYRTEIQSNGISNSEDVKEKTIILKLVEKKRDKSRIYNRGGGGNVFLGLCTLVMICLCVAMISAFVSGELSLAGIILILCFGWILIVFTLILIVLFIVRFVRNF